jgi:bifunctional non-homologous end joining protein LigD
MAGRRRPRLATYRRKRHFEHTPEPAATPRGRRTHAPAGRQFVIHLHHARRRHFDLRLQVGGVLRSWAVPKGPSRDPSIKHLAVEVEDHPLSYGSFEGTIPEGHYGAGTVAIWDEGTWGTEGSAAQQIDKGHLRFELHGSRLHGRWSLVRTRMQAGKPQWLLIKGDDEFVVPDDVADDTPLSEWKADHHIEPAARTRRASRGAKAPSLPAADRFELELARLHQRAPQGEDWLHEVKYDGYRMLAWRDGRELQLLSRNRLDWTEKLPAIADTILGLDCRNCVLDGELVVFDEHGRSRFDLLQKEFNLAKAQTVRYAVFDLLALNGDDLRNAPLLERKAALSRLLDANDPATSPLVVSGFLRGNGALAYQRACEAGLEGVMSKSVDAPYRGGRGDAWRKLKCVDSDEFVIVGYTPGKGSRGALGALLLAEPRGKAWRYVGRVGTGMDSAMLERLHDQLKRVQLNPAKTKPELIDAPNAKQLRGGRPVWVQPDTVVEVEFRGRTGDDFLRQGSFKGLRPDKSPADLRDSDRGKDTTPMASAKSPSKSAARKGTPRKHAASEPAINLTHPDRVLIERPRVTKRALAEFYASIAEHLLPGVVGRPLSLVRCPDGAGNECFFQKHPMTGMPDAIGVGDARSADGKRQDYVYVNDIAGVIGLVQMNVIEIHPWGSTIADLEHPDRLVFDLDPDTGVEWSRVRDAARLVRERLQAVGLESFLRTTGGKGLHVVVPLNPRPDWETAKAFTQALARTLEHESPQDFVSVATKNRRKGRIFVDYLRNARGSTAVASYCVRARPGAGVATPLRWEELSRLKSGAQHTFTNLPRRLKTSKQDPWQGFDEIRQALPRAG